MVADTKNREQTHKKGACQVSASTPQPQEYVFGGLTLLTLPQHPSLVAVTSAETLQGLLALDQFGLLQIAHGIFN